MNQGILYIVATPIGNLEDITLRALRILKEVNLIVCEDTRVTSKLCSHYSIEKSLSSLHQHTDDSKIIAIVEKIKAGENVAYVSDAGTPGVSDPGNKLVKFAVENEIRVEPIPGPSALATMISVAGIDMQNFTFLGFPPHKKGRQTFFKKVAEYEMPVIYFDSSHRILKNLNLLSEYSEKKVIVGKEITKIFEEFMRGNLKEIVEYLENNPQKIKGEFAVIVY